MTGTDPQDPSPALPAGVRLLHIGPHKTGTTTLQAAFHQNRDALRAQGVHYAGRRSQPMTAAMAAATGKILPTVAGSAPDRWGRLLEEIEAAAAPRTVLSSEFFCEADPAHIASIVSDLGAERTHVVVTLRPLAKIMASQWQQYMQNQMVMPYDEWLDAMLNHADETTLTPSFWRRHRHDALVRRWADVVGVQNMTVVVVDETDKQMLMRCFEQMLGLAPETLVPRDVAANRSLTSAEAQLMRAFNRRFRTAGWSAADYTQLVRFGAARVLQERRPGPDEPRVLTPQWAVDRAGALAAEMAAEIAATGVRILGDLSSLSAPPAPASVGANEEIASVPVDVAARLCSGLLTCVADVPAAPAPPARAPGPVETRVRGEHEWQRNAAALRHADARLRRLREQPDRTLRDLVPGPLRRVLRRLRPRRQ